MKRVSAVLALAITSAFAMQAASAAVTSTTRYVIISENNGKQMGEQVVENHDDGLTKVRFIYKDNGRVPPRRRSHHDQLPRQGQLDLRRRGG